MTESRYPDYVYECHDGWNDLIDDTLDKIFSIDEHFTVEQIKEKFGQLRLYGTSSYEHGSAQESRIFHIIQDAEERSGRTCEICGLPGRLGSANRWFSTLCPTHAPTGFAAASDD